MTTRYLKSSFSENISKLSVNFQPNLKPTFTQLSPRLHRRIALSKCSDQVKVKLKPSEAPSGNQLKPAKANVSENKAKSPQAQLSQIPVKKNPTLQRRIFSSNRSTAAKPNQVKYKRNNLKPNQAD
jgi:hypothetical protein